MQLLFTFAVANVMMPPSRLLGWVYDIPHCRCGDILLEMDDHDLHIVDQDALDLRHWHPQSYFFSDRLMGRMSRYVDGDSYASAALHCMHFLSYPPYVI